MASAPIINDEMSRFLIQNVKTTGIQLGRGAYGEVHEVQLAWHGMYTVFSELE